MDLVHSLLPMRTSLQPQGTNKKKLFAHRRLNPIDQKRRTHLEFCLGQERQSLTRSSIHPPIKTGLEGFLETPAIKSRMKKFPTWHVVDWIIIMLLNFFPYLLSSIDPFERIVFAHEGIRYPFKVDGTIPSSWMVFYGTFLPAAIIFCFLYFYKRASMKQIYLTTLGLLLAVGMNCLVTEILKLSVGRLRPDFINRCKPQNTSSFPVQCTGSAEIIKEGRKSFPSGHTSHAFAGLGYLSIFLLGNFKTNGVSGRSLHLLIVALPLIASTIIGVTRIDDYRHHWEDVVVGAIIGLFFAYICYRQYYPSPLSEDPQTQLFYLSQWNDVDSETEAKFSLVYDKTNTVELSSVV